MKFKPISTVNRWFGNKKFLMIFSLVCAVIFWLIIDISENPTREIILSNIKVNVANQTDDSGKDLVVFGVSESNVDVTVSGPGYIVGGVDEGDISIGVKSYQDVNKPGTYKLNLTATINASGCQITKITPSEIEVSYDYDTTAEIPVEVDTSVFEGILPYDRIIDSSSLMSKADGNELPKLAVSGPSEVIGLISKVVAVPNIPSDAEPKSQKFETVLNFYDANGNVISETQVERLDFNRDINVRIVVHKLADVKLVPTFTNLPDCYSSEMPKHTIYRYSEKSRGNEELTTVKVRGPVDTVENLISTGLSLSPIDFMKVNSENTSFNVSFILPEDVEIVDGTEEVVVEFYFGDLRTVNIELDSSDIQFIGLPDGLSAGSTLTNRSIKIKICYDRDKTRKVSASDFILNVDLTGVKAASTVTKPLIVTTVSSSTYAWAISIDPIETIIIIK